VTLKSNMESTAHKTANFLSIIPSQEIFII
jgi:hypothetical protein